MEMATMDTDELARQLDCNLKLASENKLRYLNFFTADKMPAVMAYNGQAYKHLRAAQLDTEALSFAQRHLWITCFLYGLLRPMDGIVPYRMEHCVRLEVTDDRPVHQYWKDKLTDVLIESIKADDGILIHLSTEEYEHLFDWKRVKEREGLGFGDVKFAFVAGLLLGWQRMLFAMLIASVSASIVLLILRRVRGDEQGKEYPFGPFISVGIAVSLFVGAPIITWYLGLIGF